MGYIYCITNLINSKKYVGKTTYSIKQRFQEHCRDSQKRKYENRPLYSAFNKYGIENFIIEELEFVENDDLLSDREVYWIHEIKSYGKHGYNATKGGDGYLLYDHTEIIELYNLGFTCKQVALKIGCCDDTVKKVLKANNIKIRAGDVKKIDQFDLAGNYIQHFWGSVEAAEWLVNYGLAKSLNSKCHITGCCNNKIKSAYGYIWKYGVIPE